MGRLPSPSSDGSCAHGFHYNCPEGCHSGVFTDGTVTSYRDGRTVVRVTPESTVNRTRSPNIIYDDVSRNIRWGHYVNPEKGYLALIALYGNLERLSRLDLKRLKVHAIWALRRKKLKHGGYTKYLHGPPPRDVRLSEDERELFEQLNRRDPAGEASLYRNVDKLSTNPSRFPPYMNVRKKTEASETS